MPPNFYGPPRKPVGRPREPDRYPRVKKEPEVVGLINGRVPDSVEEWRVYLSLVRYKVPFYYQVPMAGGRDFRGGVVLDYLVYNPYAIPINVNGKRWHKSDERIEEAVIAHVLKVSIDFVHDHVIWDYQIPTQEDSDRIVKLRIR